MGKVFFAERNNVHVLKFVGDVRVVLSPTITRFLNNIKTIAGLKSIVIDLTETTGIDSTTLGLLAKISLQSQDTLGAKPTLISTNENITRILASMGFEQVFVIVNQLIGEYELLAELPARLVTDAELREQVLEAHKILMSLNDKNHDCFYELVNELEKEQQREAISEQTRPGRRSAS
ncbi:MAG: STAS domain-containing protein [Pseudomonadales bacterium]|nr:STAS domain-containing protein [Pseudomonadales bacterium]